MNKEKHVAFYTKHIYTTGHTNSQRLEYLNNFFKGFGSLKEGNKLLVYILIDNMVREMCRAYLHGNSFRDKNVLNDIVNFGPNRWIMFGMKIVHMLLILIM